MLSPFTFLLRLEFKILFPIQKKRLLQEKHRTLNLSWQKKHSPEFMKSFTVTSLHMKWKGNRLWQLISVSIFQAVAIN
ncbi:hypothetical protein KIL84_018100, partial [Mauremys mutica]